MAVAILVRTSKPSRATRWRTERRGMRFFIAARSNLAEAWLAEASPTAASPRSWCWAPAWIPSPTATRWRRA
ncbi:hypothetical protein ACRAWD_16295 [Caulobacter segnis]